MDVARFTPGVQVAHLFQVVEESGRREHLRAAFAMVMVASIGPSTSEWLAGAGIAAYFEPAHPKMGVLVKEPAGRSNDYSAFKAGA